jgi:Protein of unknown function (DUF551)
MNWIDIRDRWPNHLKTVLVRSNKGFCVVVFINSLNMNEELCKTQYAHECVDLEKHPYYFVSQEAKRNTLENVTHWCELEEPQHEMQ